MIPFISYPFKYKRGMTLLEVMLALFILATAGLAVIESASQALSNQSHLQQKTFAMWVASNQLAELRLEKRWPSTSWSNETVVFANTKWYWRYKIVATGDIEFVALDVEVSEKQAGPALAYLRTYIAKP